MTVHVQTKNDGGDYPTRNCYTFANVWEVQDNNDGKYVIKLHDHECIFFQKSDVLKIEVETNGI